MKRRQHYIAPPGGAVSNPPKAKPAYTEQEIQEAREVQAEQRERDAEGQPMRINNPFWIKLGRLTAMLDDLDTSARFLEAFMQSVYYRDLPPDLREALKEHYDAISQIIHLS